MKTPIRTAVPLLFAAAVLITASCSRGLQNPQLAKFNNDANNLIMGLQQYKEFTGAYPTGENPEIAKALLGQNEKKVLILAVRKSDLSAKGEILDPWGTPLQFYFSRNGVLLRSAGPNQVFEDDLASRSDDLFRTEVPAE